MSVYLPWTKTSFLRQRFVVIPCVLLVIPWPKKTLLYELTWYHSSFKLYRIESEHESGARHLVKKQYVSELHSELHKKVGRRFNMKPLPKAKKKNASRELVLARVCYIQVYLNKLATQERVFDDPKFIAFFELEKCVGISISCDL